MSRTGDHTQETMSEDGLVPRDSRVFSCEYCGKDFGQGEISQNSLKTKLDLIEKLKIYKLDHSGVGCFRPQNSAAYGYFIFQSIFLQKCWATSAHLSF